MQLSSHKNASKIGVCSDNSFSLRSPRWMCSVRSVLVVRGSGHRGLINDVLVLWRVGFKHDPSLRRFCSKRTRSGLTRVGYTLRIIRTAHKEQRIDSVLFCLLAGHAKDTCSRCRWRMWPCTQIAAVLPLAVHKKGRRNVRSARSASPSALDIGSWS